MTSARVRIAHISIRLPSIVAIAAFSALAILQQPAMKERGGGALTRAASLAESAPRAGSETYAQAPLAFERNLGQAPPEVRFIGHALGQTVFLTNNEALVAAPHHRGDWPAVMRMRFGNGRIAPRGSEQLPGKANYFIGRDPRKWRTDIPTYSRVQYDEVAPAIRLTFHGAQSRLEHDWVIEPGGDPAQISFEFDGSERLEIDEAGSLVAASGGLQFRLNRPYAYQEKAGQRYKVKCRYLRKGPRTFGFQVGSYQREQTLVIDPVLTYAALLGGSGAVAGRHANFFVWDEGNSIAVDREGNAYITGLTVSTDFPRVNPVPPGYGGPGVFVVKLNPSGTAVLYSTVLGSGVGRGIAVDTTGSAVVTGRAYANFPVVNAFQASPGDGTDAFVAKLNPSGNALVYSTYLGGSNFDSGNGIALDAAGAAYVIGRTASANFPVTAGAMQRTLRDIPGCPSSPCGDAFIAKMTPAGGLAYSTYLGGSVVDEAKGIAVDAAGNVYITGHTYSRDFPTTPERLQGELGQCTAYKECRDAFVAKVNPGGIALVYSTYLGGGSDDSASGIAIDAEGSAYVVGATHSVDFPTTVGAVQRAIADRIGAASDIFVAKLNRSGSGLLYSTYLGGSYTSTPARPYVLDGPDTGSAIAVDAAGNAYITGASGALDFPLYNPIQLFNSGGYCFEVVDSLELDIPCTNAIIAKLDATGSKLIYSTYLGGPDPDSGSGIALDPAGNAYVVGRWGSFGFLFSLTDGVRQSPGYGAFIVRIAEGRATPAFSPSSIVNAASFVPSKAPGGLASLFGTSLVTVAGIVQAPAPPLPNELAGTSVLIDGTPVPLLAVANVGGQQQINFQIPFETRSGPTVVVIANGIKSLPITVSVAPGPGIFLVADGQPAIQHAADYQPVTASNPAARGEAIIIYATGLGDVQPRPPAGYPASAEPLSRTVLTPEVTVGGIRAEVLFSGLAPGYVGLNQVNVRVPESAPAGNLDLVMRAAGAASNVVKLPVR